MARAHGKLAPQGVVEAKWSDKYAGICSITLDEELRDGRLDSAERTA